MSGFVNVFEEYKLKHVQVPKVFLTGEGKYKDMSNDAKMAWAILRDRWTLSKKNGWFDSNGDIYFIFTQEELCKRLGVSTSKWQRVQKQLKELDLLHTKRMGQNRANRIYLKWPEISKEDMYEMDDMEETNKEEDKESHNISYVNEAGVRKFQNETSGNSKMKYPEVSKWNSNDTELSNTEFNDTEEIIVNKSDNVDNYSSESIEDDIYKLEKEYRLSGLSQEVIERVKAEVDEKREHIKNYIAYYRSCLDNTLFKSKLKHGHINMPYPHLGEDHPLNSQWLNK